jgi:hypothetical protein
MTFSREDTLTGFPLPGPMERLAVVEVNMRHVGKSVDELKGQVSEVDNKLDRLLLELAKKRSTPPGEKTALMERKSVQGGIGTVVGAALLYVIQMLTQAPAQAPKAPTETTRSHGTAP